MKLPTDILDKIPAEITTIRDVKIYFSCLSDGGGDADGEDEDDDDKDKKEKKKKVDSSKEKKKKDNKAEIEEESDENEAEEHSENGVEIEDKGKDRAKDKGKDKEKDKEKKAEEEKKKLIEKVVIKRANEFLAQFVDSSRDPFALSDTLSSVRVSEETQHQLHKLGVKNVGDFILLGFDKMAEEFEKPLLILTSKDKAALSQAKSIIEDRVEEVELY